MRVWIVTGEFEEGSRNGEVFYVLGVYSTEEAANEALRSEREEGECYGQDATGPGADDAHHKFDGMDHWCSACGEGYEISCHEVQS